MTCSIAKQIDQKAEFREAFWEEHIDATLKGIRELKHDIVRALREFQPEIDRGNNGLGPDGPTDVIWIISLLFIIRTIGMLGSKSTDNRRPEENKREHVRLLQRYIEDINTTDRKKILLDYFQLHQKRIQMYKAIAYDNTSK